MMKDIFIDADIILDLLAERRPFYSYSANLFSHIDKGKIKGYTSPVIITNIYYILSKLLNKNQAKRHVQKLITLVKILPVNEKIVELALSSNFTDLEDAIQYYTAIENDIEYLITRNIKDYKSAEIVILTAEEYLKMLK